MSAKSNIVVVTNTRVDIFSRKLCVFPFISNIMPLKRFDNSNVGLRSFEVTIFPITRHWR